MTAEIIAGPKPLYLIMLPGLLKFCYHRNWPTLVPFLTSFFFPSKIAPTGECNLASETDSFVYFFLALIVSKYHSWFSKRLKEILEDFPEEVAIGLCKILASTHGLKLCGNYLRKGQEEWQNCVCTKYIPLVPPNLTFTFLHPGALCSGS